MSGRSGTPSAARSRLAPVVALAGLVTTLVLALSTGGALAGFTAGITGGVNGVAAGVLLMTESRGLTTCVSSTGTIGEANAGTCSAIDSFGAASAAAPGTPHVSTISISNTGTIPASSLSLTAGDCTARVAAPLAGSGTASFCGKVVLAIDDATSGRCVFPASATPCPAPSAAQSLTALADRGPITLATPIAVGQTVTFSFTVMIDGSATNEHQGLAASQTLNWSFAS